MYRGTNNRKEIAAKRKKQKRRMTDLRGSRIEKLVCISKEGNIKKREIRNDNKFPFLAY